MTPIDCLSGFTADTPSNLNHKPQPINNSEDYISELRSKLQRGHELAR